MEQNNLPHKSGFIAVVGRPNVGKSTLINTLLGQKIAAVSARPQMTRRRQLGIFTEKDFQMIFVDTPGIHKPVHKLGEYMNQVALNTLEDSDVILWLVDVSVMPTLEDQIVAAKLASLRNPLPVVLVLNKADQVDSKYREKQESVYLALHKPVRTIWLSALSKASCTPLVEMLVELLPEGPLFYDAEDITDLYERDIAVDLIREAVMAHLHDEIPHAVAVRIDEYSDRSEDMAYISATLLVERETHKGILIGKNAEMIKKIGTTARQEIERMSGHKIFLELRAKVQKDWRDNPATLKTLGYATQKDKGE
jgi:GTPase